MAHFSQCSMWLNPFHPIFLPRVQITDQNFKFPVDFQSKICYSIFRAKSLCRITYSNFHKNASQVYEGRNIMTELHISSLNNYLCAIENLKTYYPTGMIANNPISTNFLYRGLADRDYHLLPGIFRKDVAIIDGENIVNDKYLTWAEEVGVLRAFIHEASAYLSIPSNDLGHWLEYAQHYGVPTRLLDWSKNPLVALYFCCKDQSEKDGAVWLLHVGNYSRFISNKLGNQDDRGFKTIYMAISELLNGHSRYEYPILYTPYYVDARMSAQGSYFMIWGNQRKPLEDLLPTNDIRMNLPEKDNGTRTYGIHESTALLFRFLIYADRKQPILHELDSVGINEKTLFPGLDGIGRYIERQYRFDYNEMVENI